MALDIIDLNLKLKAIQALINVTENSLSLWNNGGITPDGYFAEIYTLSLASKHLSEIVSLLDGVGQ
ncbi:hypothetical protein [Polynucleobacter sp. Fuers-14]|uniref:hypothetical protein n=1 Tax=Polynucleobacter sp. Fuers-14 TaxID=1758364 RepID=UPI001C0CA5A9|nr:hypothetical protein [Polynucleobacter sp. Fuers-14]MBU3640992.1 hypothetical protein [Polynucleobacter sp. Fuers-14]